MVPLILTRLPPFTTRGAFGVLQWWGIPICVTLERVYPHQRVQVPRLPPGQYTLERAMFHGSEYVTWQVVGGELEADRRILLHKGTVVEEADGCILIGESFDALNGLTGIAQSGIAFRELMTLTSDMINVEFHVKNA
jgi:hypothetical protein